MVQNQSSLPAEGYVRLSGILGPHGPVPVSKSTWWAGVKSGRFPPSEKLSPRITVWRVDDIRALIAAPQGPALSKHIVKPAVYGEAMNSIEFECGVCHGKS